MRRPGLRSLLFHVLLLALLVLLGAAAERHPWEFDLSRTGRNTPHPATAALLAQLEGRIAITAFAPELPVLRAGITDLVARLRRGGGDIELQFLDPARDPVAARDAGVRRVGTLQVAYGGRVELVERPDEARVAEALARLSHRGAPWIVALTGSGERDLRGSAPTELGRFGQLLEQFGYRVLPLALADTPQLPANAALVVLAAATAELGAGERQALAQWLEDGGAVLWLAEGTPRPGDLAAELGLRPLPGVVVDAAAAALGQDAPTVAVAARHAEHAATRALDAPVLLPGALAWELDEDTAWRATPLLQSSPRSWNERGALTGNLRRDADADERLGPLPVGVSLVRQAQRGEQRVAVLGDVDLFSNAGLGLGANRAFGLALVNWLTGEHRLLNVPPRQAPDLRLDWTPRAGAWAVGLLLLGLPGALAATGGWLRWYRRRG